jgi:CRP-like cAMP-binding protein
MKLVSHDEVMSGGYTFPSEGLCFNMSRSEAEAFRAEGEWVLSEDELIANEGESQSFLYMVVSGQVDLFKMGNSGQKEKINSLVAGSTFGEVAFLKGRISSVTAQTKGNCLLWRMDYERLLSFITVHSASAGQLCLNLAGVLAGRLVDGNQKVLEIRTELQESIKHLESVHSEEQLKTKALKNMQQKLVSMQHGFRANSAKKETFGTFPIICLTIAFLCTVGFFVVLFSGNGITIEEMESLNDEVIQLVEEKEVGIELRKKLESDVQDITENNQALLEDKVISSQKIEEIEKELLEKQGNISELQKLLDEAENEIVRLQLSSDKDDELVQDIPEEFITNLMEWVKINSDSILPVEVKITKEAIALSDREQLVRIPIAVDGTVFVNQLHPEFKRYLVVGQKESSKFLASIQVGNTNFIERVAGEYIEYMKLNGEIIQNPFLKKEE